MRLNVLDPRPTNIVNCGKCNECCRGDAIFMHPECGDNASTYKTEQYQGRLILRHKPNGDCIYLDRDKGCMIWERRPTICRELDCAMMLDLMGEATMRGSGLGRLVEPARRLKRDGVGSCEQPSK